ncbi:MAG: substrate-binding domain-containing protein [Cyanobacteria bacterium P01_H01_bin.105]
MQQQQDKTLLVITLAGLGLIAGIFGLVTWLIDGPGPAGPVTQSRQSNSDSNTLATANNDEEVTLKGIENVPQGLFNYGGSTTWIPAHESVNGAIASAFPDFQLRYTLPSSGSAGSGKGIEMLLDGQLSFAESSRSLRDSEYLAAKQRGFTLEQIPAAIDGIALAVHPNLDLPGLTVSQIQAIYTGQVINWSELGGPDLPISAYSRSPEEAGTAQYFLDSIMDTDTYGENVLFVGDTTTGLRQVLDNVGGIYFASAPEIVNQCSIYPIPVAAQEQPENFITPFTAPWRTGRDCLEQENTVNKVAFRDGSYPLTRRLFVVVKAEGGSDEAAGRAYAKMLLSSEGQALIDQAGFISIR